MTMGRFILARYLQFEVACERLHDYGVFGSTTVPTVVTCLRKTTQGVFIFQHGNNSICYFRMSALLMILFGSSPAHTVLCCLQKTTWLWSVWFQHSTHSFKLHAKDYKTKDRFVYSMVPTVLSSMRKWLCRIKISKKKVICERLTVTGSFCSSTVSTVSSYLRKST